MKERILRLLRRSNPPQVAPAAEAAGGGRVYSCDPVEKVEPNKGHLAYHRKQAEEPCQQAKRETSAYRYVLHHGTLEGWNTSPTNPSPTSV